MHSTACRYKVCTSGTAHVSDCFLPEDTKACLCRCQTCKPAIKYLCNRTHSQALTGPIGQLDDCKLPANHGFISIERWSFSPSYENCLSQNPKSSSTLSKLCLLRQPTPSTSPSRRKDEKTKRWPPSLLAELSPPPLAGSGPARMRCGKNRSETLSSWCVISDAAPSRPRMRLFRRGRGIEPCRN